MVYWSITEFFPVESCFNMQPGDHRSRMGCWCPLEEGRGRWRKETAAGSIGNQSPHMRCVMQIPSISKDNSVLPGMWTRSFLLFFFQHKDTYCNICKYSLPCLAPAFYLKCVFQGNAIWGPQCLIVFSKLSVKSDTWLNPHSHSVIIFVTIGHARALQISKSFSISFYYAFF